MRVSWMGLGLLVGCGPAVGTTGDDGSSSTGGDTSADTSPGELTGASASVGDPSSASDTVVDTGDVSTSSNDTGEPAQTRCVVVSPIDALQGLELPALPARVAGGDRDELWRVEQQWSPFTKELALHLTPHLVDPSGIATPGGTIDLVGRFVRFDDVDGDGRDDVILHDDAGTWSWHASDGNGGFAAAAPLEVPDEIGYGLQWLDGDGDGDVDIFRLGDVVERASLWRGDGQGGFASTTPFSAQAFAGLSVVESVLVAPSGALVLQVGNGAIGFGYMQAMWRVEIDGDTLVPTTSTSTDVHTLSGVGDFGSDGFDDIVVALENEEMHLWQGVADGFEDHPLDSASNSIIVVADLLGSGSAALLVAQPDGAGQIFEAPQDPDIAPIDLHGDEFQYGDGTVVDFDGDGVPELLRSVWAKGNTTDHAIVKVQPCE